GPSTTTASARTGGTPAMADPQDAWQRGCDSEDALRRVARLRDQQLLVDRLAEEARDTEGRLRQARRRLREARWELATLTRLVTGTGPAASRPARPVPPPNVVPAEDPPGALPAPAPGPAPPGPPPCRAEP